MDLDFKLFKGASIEFFDKENAGETAAKVAAMPQVKQIWPKKLYRRPDDEVLWAGEPTPGDALTKRAAQDTFSPHVMTQVDRLKAKGITGDGIKLAIVDTGVSSIRRRRDPGEGSKWTLPSPTDRCSLSDRLQAPRPWAAALGRAAW